MSDIPGSPQFIQFEATQFRAPVSEAIMQEVGASVNYLLSNIMPVGSIIESMLDEATFQSQTGVNWVLCDGRSVTGSAYQTLTGSSTIPDALGRYSRTRSYASGNDPAGDLAVGSVYADALQAHTHSVAAAFTLVDTDPSNTGDIVKDMGSEFLRSTTTLFSGGPISGNVNFSETRVRTIVFNKFIRID